MGRRIAEHVLHMTGLRTSAAEVRSWDRSLPVLAQDLLDCGLGQIEMLVEHRLPLTSMRVDVILAGIDRRTGEDAYVVVELKQWSAAQIWENSEGLLVVEGVRGPRLHPLVQVRGYCEHLTDFTASLDGRAEAVKGIAYLHNATDHSVHDLFELPPDDHGRLFTAQRRSELLQYLSDRFAPPPRRWCRGSSHEQRCPP